MDRRHHQKGAPVTPSHPRNHCRSGQSDHPETILICRCGARDDIAAARQSGFDSEACDLARHGRRSKGAQSLLPCQFGVESEACGLARRGRRVEKCSVTWPPCQFGFDSEACGLARHGRRSKGARDIAAVSVRLRVRGVRSGGMWDAVEKCLVAVGSGGIRMEGGRDARGCGEFGAATVGGRGGLSGVSGAGFGAAADAPSVACWRGGRATGRRARNG